MARPEQLGKEDVLEFLRSTNNERDILDILNQCNLSLEILHKDEPAAAKRKRQKQEVPENNDEKWPMLRKTQDELQKVRGGGGRSKRLLKEVKDALREAPEGIDFGISNFDKPLYWEAVLEGPKGTPYEGGKFRVSFELPFDYPFKQPYNFRFKTKVYHPMVCNKSGEHAGITTTSSTPNTGIPVILSLIKDLYRLLDIVNIVDMEGAKWMQTLSGPRGYQVCHSDMCNLLINDKQTFWKKAEEWTLEGSEFAPSA